MLLSSSVWKVLVAVRVFSLKGSSAGAFPVPFRVLNRKNYDRRYNVFS